ncbi:B-cell scaffold protein with ankyrin repeats isoform X1 [Sander lucioperca]|uniref:B-cell scaffold protein with ankyrin repeats isoform X1 n=1 Tax=Sander lucioperca TaxID=283035 RepID=UPI00125CDD0C|nr:B-cell scaffold protein with ankyrin repeats isoform X1 [Sander lucioperca]XP_031141009.1 B-cell scaffold protein with ankyrin repeats isoform X1 [Sander lucioperca]XP_031141010.1 B-cell scaffold protein with ankyrin repeats isoform X1 [Sander lucioperca]
MSQTAEELLIIYESEAEQWATYLHSVFTGPISEAGICCYDIAAVSSRQDDFLRLAHYTCKLLILSKGMLEGLCQKRRFFLARVLRPAAHVVVLLCGVESLTPLLELVPLNGDECLKVSSEQDAHEYLSTVTDIVRKGALASAANVNPFTRKLLGSEQKVEQMQSTGAHSVRSSIVAVPSRVPCGSSMEVFILLKNESAGSDAELEFTGENQTLRLKPVCWNERILCVNAPDFPAGYVRVTVYSNGVPLIKTQLQYYSNMDEITCLLAKAADPVDFMCQALQESSVEKLDQKLSSMLLEGMPTGGFRGLQCENTPERELHHADAPSLLHFAAQYGFKSVSSLLLQCPGAERALHTANRHGQTPTQIAKSHGHTELHVLLKETLNTFNSGKDNGDASVYEMMCAAGTPSTKHEQTEQRGGDEEGEEEDIYAPLRVNDEYDTILNSTKAVVIANRPPAPTPRPESTQGMESGTPYITQVFQKKKKTPQHDADLYSLPTKQAHGRENSISCTYDTFVPNQINGLQQLIELQQRVKAGSLTVDGALERFSDWQRVQKGMDGVQQEKLSQLRASIVNNREDDDSVYDKINIVHHMPSVTVSESRRGSKAVESDFYSKPFKGQHSGFFSKADKR